MGDSPEAPKNMGPEFPEGLDGERGHLGPNDQEIAGLVNASSGHERMRTALEAAKKINLPQEQIELLHGNLHEFQRQKAEALAQAWSQIDGAIAKALQEGEALIQLPQRVLSTDTPMKDYAQILAVRLYEAPEQTGPDPIPRPEDIIKSGKPKIPGLKASEVLGKEKDLETYPPVEAYRVTFSG